MTTPLQPATRRLLTEAAAAAHAADPATPLGAELAGQAADYERAANRGVPGGYAALGPDGIVPATQLPAGEVRYSTVLAADVPFPYSTTTPGDVNLEIPVVPAGAYLLEAVLMSDVGGAMRLLAAFARGSRAGMSGRLISYSETISTFDLSSSAAYAPSHGIDYALFTGMLALTEPRLICLDVAQNNSSSNTLYRGTFLRLTRID